MEAGRVVLTLIAGGIVDRDRDKGETRGGAKGAEAPPFMTH